MKCLLAKSDWLFVNLKAGGFQGLHFPLPALAAVTYLLAGGIDRVGAYRAAVIAPLGAHIRNHGGQFIRTKRFARRRHRARAKGFAGHGDGADQPLLRDGHDGGGIAQHPLGTRQRWDVRARARAIGLVTGHAAFGIDLFAARHQQFLGRRCQRSHFVRLGKGRVHVDGEIGVQLIHFVAANVAEQNEHDHNGHRHLRRAGAGFARFVHVGKIFAHYSLAVGGSCTIGASGSASVRRLFRNSNKASAFSVGMMA